MNNATVIITVIIFDDPEYIDDINLPIYFIDSN